MTHANGAAPIERDLDTYITLGDLKAVPCAACGRSLYLPPDFVIPRDGMICGNACSPRLPGIYLCYPPPTGEPHDIHSNI